MDLIKKIIILLLVYVFLSIIISKKHVNLTVVFYGITSIIIAFIEIFLIFAVISLQPIINNAVILLEISALLILLIFTIILSKNKILGLISILDYYIHKEKAFKNGKIETGIISNIKSEGYGRGEKRYYLIVDFNGKQIKSNYFSYNTYSIRENINVLVYKNHKYVVLKNKI